MRVLAVNKTQFSVDSNYPYKISELVILYLKEDLDLKGQEELNNWRKESEKHETMFQRMISSEEFNRKVNKFVKSASEAENDWLELRKLTITGRRKHPHISLMKYAALFIIPMAVGSLLYFSQSSNYKNQITKTPEITAGSSFATLLLPNGKEVRLGNNSNVNLPEISKCIVNVGDTLQYENQQGKPDPEEIEYHTIKVPRKGEYNLKLSDGTIVFLNSESKLRYPVPFKGKFRKVYLEGEAFFQVKSNKDKPFIVDVNQMKVKVLGTSFGVRSYKDEDRILTTLVEGKVFVSVPHINGKTILQPSYQACFNKKECKLESKIVDVEQYVGWKDGRLVFDNTPLDKILRELSRWYDFEVFYMNKDLKDIPFSINIKKYDDFNEILDVLEKTQKLKFRIKGKAVIVK